jgi:hypothetical protein
LLDRVSIPKERDALWENRPFLVAIN